MRAYFLCCLVALLVAGPTIFVPLHGQQAARADLTTLRQQTREHPLVDSAGFQAFTNLANYWIYYDPDSAEYYVDLLLAEPELQRLMRGRLSYRPQMIKGWVYQSRGDIDKAREWLLRAAGRADRYAPRGQRIEVQLNLLATFTATYSPEALAAIDTMLTQLDTSYAEDQYVYLQLQQLRASQLFDSGRNEKSIAIMTGLLESEMLYSNENNREVIDAVYRNLSYYLEETGDTEAALRYMRQALHNSLPGAMSDQWLRMSLTDLLIDLGRFDEARQELAVVAEQGLNPTACFDYYINLARIGTSEKQPAAVADALTEAGRCSEVAEDPFLLLRLRISEGFHYLGTGATERLAKVAKAAGELMEQHPQVKRPSVTEQVRFLQAASAVAQNTDEAPTALRNYRAAAEAYRDYQTDRIGKELVVQYETRQRQDSITLLNLENETKALVIQQRNIQVLGIGGLLLLAVAGGLFVWNTARRRRRLNAILAERNTEINRQNDALLNANARIALLNENISHNTANFLNRMIELLTQQQERTTDPELTATLTRQIMAFRRLQQLPADEANLIDLSEYLPAYAEDLRKAFAGPDLQPVNFAMVASVAVPTRTAADLALMYQELLTNSVKYARRDGATLRSRLRIDRWDDRWATFRYEDDGPAAANNRPAGYSSGKGRGQMEVMVNDLKGEPLADPGLGPFGLYFRFPLPPA